MALWSNFWGAVIGMQKHFLGLSLLIWNLITGKWNVQQVVSCTPLKCKKINHSCCFLDKIANCCSLIHEKCKRLWSCSVQIIMTANHLWRSVRMILDPPQMAASAVCWSSTDPYNLSTEKVGFQSLQKQHDGTSDRCTGCHKPSFWLFYSPVHLIFNNHSVCIQR